VCVSWTRVQYLGCRPLPTARRVGQHKRRACRASAACGSAQAGRAWWRFRSDAERSVNLRRLPKICEFDFGIYLDFSVFTTPGFQRGHARSVRYRRCPVGRAVGWLVSPQSIATRFTNARTPIYLCRIVVCVSPC
jgi:hypothetical protein